MSPTLPLPLDEGDEVAPVDVYGEEKYAAELICQQAAERGDLAIPILRFAGVYGPGKAAGARSDSSSANFRMPELSAAVGLTI